MNEWEEKQLERLGKKCAEIDKPSVSAVPSNDGVMPRGWAEETMMLINKLTPDIKGKAFDPDWFMLRQRLEEAESIMVSKGV